MTSKKLGALLRSAPPATARAEAPEPAGSATRPEPIPIAELEGPQRAVTMPTVLELEVPLQVLIPERVRRQLAMKAAEEGRSLRSLVLTALRGLGIDVSEADIKGKRGRRNA
jgi:hypothetical protein